MEYESSVPFGAYVKRIWGGFVLDLSRTKQESSSLCTTVRPITFMSLNGVVLCRAIKNQN